MFKYHTATSLLLSCPLSYILFLAEIKNVEGAAYQAPFDSLSLASTDLISSLVTLCRQIDVPIDTIRNRQGHCSARQNIWRKYGNSKPVDDKGSFIVDCWFAGPRSGNWCGIVDVVFAGELLVVSLLIISCLHM